MKRPEEVTLSREEGNARNGQGQDAEDHEQNAEDAHGLILSYQVAFDPRGTRSTPRTRTDANAVPLGAPNSSETR